MNNQPQASASLLARELAKRMEQLGLSKREFCRRTGLSRQTVHNIEAEGRTELKGATLHAIDTGLYWEPGTALALSMGDASALDKGDALARVDKESAYRWQIVERIQRMSLADLERMVSMMEGEALGSAEPMSTDDVIAKVEARIMETINRRLGASAAPNNGNQSPE